MGRIAEIVAYDKSRDLALLKVKDTERQMPYVATLYPEGLDNGPWIFSNCLCSRLLDLGNLRFLQWDF